jgi:hypothetical protein
MFVVRRLVRQNPWLLAKNGFARRSATFVFGPLELELETETILTPSQKAKLQAEADAGTLFPRS